jgi:hypothetical protein
MTFPRRFYAGLLIVVVFTVFLFALNIFEVDIDWAQATWRPLAFVPALKTVGSDFREGWLAAAQQLRETGSIGVTVYPPLVTAMGLPFSFLPEMTAYGIQVGLLYLANLLVLALAVYLLQRILDSLGGFDLARRPLFQVGFYAVAGLLFFLNVTSYGFLFSLERGNTDVVAILLALLALALLVLKPDSLWLQVICLSVAAHLKIYPAILFLLLFWRHRWKLILPALVVNLVFLLILGPANALTFLENFASLMFRTYYWFGNHSAASFAVYIDSLYPGLGNYALVYTAVPLLIWLAGVLYLWKQGYSSLRAILLFILSVPVMSTTTGISHDYKLVILIAPLFFMLCLLMLNAQARGKISDLVFIALVMLVFLFIFRSGEVVDALLRNKYPFLLLFEILIALRIPSLSRLQPVQ